MKKTLLLLVIAVVPLTARAGFVGPSEQAIMSVSEVRQLGDDKAVVMKGSIEKHLSKDKYQFVDGTGRVVVEIDGEEWRGQNVTPNDTVIIIGETEKDLFSDPLVDVNSVEVVKNTK
jgi:uncharacterized protein (TIGR00156 family)